METADGLKLSAIAHLSQSSSLFVSVLHSAEVCAGDPEMSVVFPVPRLLHLRRKRSSHLISSREAIFERVLATFDAYVLGKRNIVDQHKHSSRSGNSRFGYDVKISHRTDRVQPISKRHESTALRQ